MKRRALQLVCVFIVIYAANFFLPRLMPGDPLQYTSAVSGEDMDGGYSAEQREMLRSYYGLDRPLGEQFLKTLGQNLRGELGESIFYKKPVSQALLERAPWSLWVMGAALAVSLAAGCAAALWCVQKPRADRAAYLVFSVLAELPAFLTGVLLLFFVAGRLGWFPLSGGMTPFLEYTSVWGALADILWHSALPILTLALGMAPGFFFTARASFLTALEKPFLLGAQAKGLARMRIRLQYILRNSLPPLRAKAFLSVGRAVGGTVLVENVFAYPGLGKALREAVAYRDYPMIQGRFLLSAALLCISLFCADLLGAKAEGRELG